MGFPTPAQHRRVRPCLAVAAALVLASASVWAAPEDAPDAVTRLLVERGLLEAPASAPPTRAPVQEHAFVRQVRDKASDMVISAMNFLGVPYRRGGVSAEDGFDCSGFTRHVFELSLGLVLPRRVDEQASASGLQVVKRDELKPGDLVFFNTLKRTFSHVGIYVGEGKFIHSPRSGAQVRVEDMRYAYWSKRFTGARRAEPLRTLAEVGEAPSTAPLALELRREPVAGGH
jgi:cell wall-associated NlpC family hydrolase